MLNISLLLDYLIIGSFCADTTAVLLSSTHYLVTNPSRPKPLGDV